MKKVYNKLVRDKIPEIIENDNHIPKTRILSDNQYKIELIKKLKEEAEELIAASDDKKELKKELSDIYEIIDNIIEKFDLDKDEVLALQEKRRVERGGFDKKIFLESVSEKED